MLGADESKVTGADTGLVEGGAGMERPVLCAGVVAVRPRGGSSERMLRGEVDPPLAGRALEEGADAQVRGGGGLWL